MRKFMLALAATTLVAGSIVPVSSADARKYREWRGRDGRVHCTRSNGTTGLVVGGIAGALVGRGIAGRGDKTVGTILGGVGGAFGGQAIDKTITKKRRCR